MSDGPHRSLPMRRAWKTLAAQADNKAFTLDHVAEAACFALAGDWQMEIPPTVVKAVASVFGDEAQTGLFTGDIQALTRLRTDSGSPLMAAFIDAAADVITDGLRGPQAIERAIEATLLERALRELRAVEEHFLRRSPRDRAVNVRVRLENSVALAPLGELARAIAKGAASVRRFQPEKRDGLDEGVPL